MSTFGFFVGRLIIFGFRDWIIWKLSSAVAFVLLLFFRRLISPRTSWGIMYSIFSEVIWFREVSMSSFCFAQVRMKFVSRRIFIGENRLRLCFWFLVVGCWF